eukprot:3147530-Pleurochrysis_carterae.AAC.1
MRASVCAHCVLECGARTGGVAAGTTPVGSMCLSARVARVRAVPATEGHSARERRSASLFQTLWKCWPLCERALSNET